MTHSAGALLRGRVGCDWRGLQPAGGEFCPFVAHRVQWAWAGGLSDALCLRIRSDASCLWLHDFIPLHYPPTLLHSMGLES